jgi:hypothetical protein
VRACYCAFTFIDFADGRSLCARGRRRQLPLVRRKFGFVALFQLVVEPIFQFIVVPSLFFGLIVVLPTEFLVFVLAITRIGIFFLLQFRPVVHLPESL